ncbi:hypothetical protein V3851_20230 [Paenibacillus sp. M1]|uniref:Uncharacterized protein n=1 Tax=Paenibacillus haidiansis TaxID=1574488 RepID=A0ABU7VY03_9BACL
MNHDALLRRPSSFNVQSESDDGGLVLYNSYTGVIALFSPEERNQVLEWLKAGTPAPDPAPPLYAGLVEHGFLVHESTDELRRALYYCYGYFPLSSTSSGSSMVEVDFLI